MINKMDRPIGIATAYPPNGQDTKAVPLVTKMALSKRRKTLACPLP